MADSDGGMGYDLNAKGIDYDSGSDSDTCPMARPQRPPFPELRGEWVKSRDCTQIKSFSWLACERAACARDDGSSRRWFSAHGNRNFAQRCQQCEYEVSPAWMWNTHTAVNQVAADQRDDAKGPHDVSRCEACRHATSGDCRNKGKPRDD